MKMSNGCTLGAALLTLTLSGCEMIQAFFPDKQKDYRYSAEIPPLNVPTDLKSDAIKTQDDIRSPAAATVVPAGETSAEQAAPATATNIETPGKTGEKPQQNLVSWSGGNTRLLINEDIDKAWLIVAKALTHKAVEITDRDKSQGVFFVVYDPQKYEIKDGSIWDEVAFFFGSRDSHEEPYRVRVLRNGKQTDVLVTDDRDVLIVQGPGLSLLNLIYESIKADAEEKAKPADEEQKKSEADTQEGAEKQQNPEGETKDTAEKQPSLSGESDTRTKAEDEAKPPEGENAIEQPKSEPESSPPNATQ